MTRSNYRLSLLSLLLAAAWAKVDLTWPIC